MLHEQAHASPGEHEAPDRDAWQALLPHRAALLRMARARVSAADAEDVVAEALLRTVGKDVEASQVGAYLNVVVRNLCTDLLRDQAMGAHREAYSVQHGGPEPAVEEAVCDRAEAQWLAGQLGALPARQQQALALRARGLTLEVVARELGASYKTTESLLSRARAAARARLETTYGLPLVSALVPKGWGAATTAAPVAVGTVMAGVMVTALLGLQTGGGRPSPDLATTPVGAVPAAAAPIAPPIARRPPGRALSRTVVQRTDRTQVTAPSRLAATPVPSSPKPKGRTIVAGQTVDGPLGVQVTGGDVVQHDEDRTFQQSAADCLRYHSQPGNLARLTTEGTCPPDRIHDDEDRGQ